MMEIPEGNQGLVYTLSAVVAIAVILLVRLYFKSKERPSTRLYDQALKGDPMSEKEEVLKDVIHLHDGTVLTVTYAELTVDEYEYAYEKDDIIVLRVPLRSVNFILDMQGSTAVVISTKS